MWEKVTGFYEGVISNIKKHVGWTRDSYKSQMSNLMSDIPTVLHIKGRRIHSKDAALCVLLAAFGGLVIFIIVRKRKKISSVKKRSFMKGLATWTNAGVEGLRVTTDLIRPELVPDDHVLIRVEAVGIHPIDISILYGLGRKNVRGSELAVPGRDCSGVVIKTGAAVTDVAIGEKVWAFSPPSQTGLMSEFASVPECQVTRMPNNLTFEDAASIPYVSQIIWQALCNHGNLGSENTKGKRVLVHVGSSADGCLAIQLVKAWGGHVTTTVPTRGLPLTRLLGADDVIVFSVTDFQEELKSREKFDVILNTVMGSTLHNLCLELCSVGGKVISTTKPFSGSHEIKNITKCLKYLKDFGTKTTRAIFKTIQAETVQKQCFTYDREILNKVCKLIENKKIVPVVEEVYSVDDGVQAFERVADGNHVGRIVVKF